MSKHRSRIRRLRRPAAFAAFVLVYLLITPLPGHAVVAGTWKSISVGDYHICGIAMDDTAWCWGGNYDGPVGDGTSENNRLSPTRVLTDGPLPDTYKAISAGTNHTCAIAMDDTAWCWGNDADGALGDDDGSALPEPSPVPVKTGGGLPATYKRISAGYFATCAIAGDNTAWCWGLNDFGQLGDASKTKHALPVAVSTTGSPATYKAISMGDHHTCALAADDAAWCWGKNDKLQLGLVSGGPVESSVPVAVATGGGLPAAYASISSGRDHACALTASGVAWCWGEGFDGEVGRGADYGSDVPILVDTTSGRPATYAEIAGGGIYTCAVASVTGAPWCWGDDAQGQLGNGAAGDQNAPDDVVVEKAPPYHGLSAGNSRVCAIADDATAWCWGGGVDIVPVQILGGVSSMLTGRSITYTGDTYISSAGNATLRAQLAGPEACLSDVEVTFAFDSDGDGTYGEDPDDLGSVTETTDGSGVAAVVYVVTSEPPGPLYEIEVSVEEGACNAASNTGVLVVAGSGDASNGGGWYRSGVPGVGRTNFGYTVQVRNGSRTIVAGQISWHTTGATRTRFKGTVTAYTKACPAWVTGAIPSGLCGYLSGTGSLSTWTGSHWELRAMGIGFRVVVVDGGTAVSCNRRNSCTTVLKLDHFLMDLPTATVAGESTAVTQLSGGNLKVR